MVRVAGEGTPPGGEPPNPRPLDTPDSPEVYHRDLTVQAIVYGWTIDAIRAALTAHAQGQFGPAAFLIDTVLGDDRVQATLGSRTGALFGQKVVHTKAEADTDGKCAAAWQAQWGTMTRQGSLQEAKRWAIMNSFSVSQIVWDTASDPWTPRLIPWPIHHVRYDWTRRCLMTTTAEGEEVITPGAGKWFVHAPYGLYRGWLHASIRAIAPKWLLKELTWRDWARFNERHGLPIIKAYVPAAGDAKQKANFVASMATLGQEAVVGLPQNVDETGYDLELLEAKDRGFESFGSLIDSVDRSIVLTIKSQNLTTEVNEGSYAAARQHGGTEQVTLEFDNLTFAQDLYEQVARPFALFNFGDADKATRSQWDTTPDEDYGRTATTLSAFAQALAVMKNAGYQVDDVEALASQYGIKLNATAVTLPDQGPANE